MLVFKVLSNDNNKKKNEGYQKDVEENDNQEGDDKTDDLMNEKNCTCQLAAVLRVQSIMF